MISLEFARIWMKRESPAAFPEKFLIICEATGHPTGTFSRQQVLPDILRTGLSGGWFCQAFKRPVSMPAE